MVGQKSSSWVCASRSLGAPVLLLYCNWQNFRVYFTCRFLKSSQCSISDRKLHAPHCRRSMGTLYGVLFVCLFVLCFFFFMLQGWKERKSCFYPSFSQEWLYRNFSAFTLDSISIYLLTCKYITAFSIYKWLYQFYTWLKILFTNPTCIPSQRVSLLLVDLIIIQTNSLSWLSLFLQPVVLYFYSIFWLFW